MWAISYTPRPGISEGGVRLEYVKGFPSKTRQPVYTKGLFSSQPCGAIATTFA